MFTELSELKNFRHAIKSLNQAGRAIKVDNEKINKEEKNVVKMKLCRSNDIHVIALARVSNVRLLCTNDDNLIADFKNTKLISSPKGKIYKSQEHKSLLKHTKNCIGKITKC